MEASIVRSPLLGMQLFACFGELLADFRGIWQLLRQTAQLVQNRLARLFSRVGFGRGG
jgi:hypothetical protein